MQILLALLLSASAGEKQVVALVTAYCPCTKCCGKSSNGVTSTGKDAYSRGVAVDPKAIPYGATVVIPGYGTVKADDTGGAMRKAWSEGKYHLDVRYKRHGDALQWGRRRLRITVKE